MIHINGLSSLQSFEEVIPHAAAHGERYLQLIAQGVERYSPPVTMDVDEIAPPGIRRKGPRTPCLVLTPDEKRLRKYPQVHFGETLGASLRAGWHLLGGERVEGNQVGIMNFGGLRQQDGERLFAMAKLVHDYAVLPAMQQIADLVSGAKEGPGGFFGV